MQNYKNPSNIVSSFIKKNQQEIRKLERKRILRLLTAIIGIPAIIFIAIILLNIPNIGYAAKIEAAIFIIPILIIFFYFYFSFYFSDLESFLKREFIKEYLKKSFNLHPVYPSFDTENSQKFIKKNHKKPFDLNTASQFVKIIEKENNILANFDFSEQESDFIILQIIKTFNKDKEIYNELMLDDDKKNSVKMEQEHNDAREKELQNKYQNSKLTKSQILKEYIEKYKRLFEVTNIFPKYLKLLKLFKKSGISDSTLKSNEILQDIMAGVYKENSLKFWHIDMFEYSNSNGKSFEFKGLFIELYNKNLCYKYSNEGFLIISQNSPVSKNKNIIDKNMKKFYKNYNIVFSNDRISPELLILLNNLANQKIKVSVSYEMGNINIMLKDKFKKLYGIALYKSLNNPKSYNSIIKEIYKIFRIIDSFIEIC